MEHWRKQLKIIHYMFLEEFRLQAAMVGLFQFLFFPVFILVCCLVLSIASNELLEEVALDRIYLILHGMVALYGLGVGGFALFGEEMAERRIGQVNLLLTTPTLHPVDFRSIFFLFYVKDTIFYLVFTICPIILGMGLSVPITGFSLSGLLYLTLGLSLSFLVGISFSFFLSTLYVRWKRVFTCVGLAALVLLVGAWQTDLYGLEHLLPSLMFQYTRELSYLGLTLLLILLFSAFAVRFLKLEFGRKSQRYPHQLLETEKRFSFIRNYSVFLAKEWIDLRRSGTLAPVMFAYIGPLVILSIMVWFLTDVAGLSLDFNMVFYSSMIGFFGITIYAWLNMVDAPNYYEVLPVTLPRLIKTKLVMFLLLSLSISTVFLVGLGLFRGEAGWLILGLPVAYTTTPYTVVVTAYLTGLRTNSYLFDPRILGRFMFMVALPLILIMLASFSLEEHGVVSVSIIGVVCAVLLVLIYPLYRGLERKWGRESFVF